MITALRLGIALSLICGSLALAGPAPAQGRYGAWAAAADTLPPDFRGRITYSGSHQGELVASRRTRQYSGRYNLELEINGNTLRGRYSGTGGINSGTVSGTRTGNRCRLIDDRWGTVTEAECTRSRFAGTARSPAGEREQTRMNIDARATRLADAAAVPPAAPTALPTQPTARPNLAPGTANGASSPLTAEESRTIQCGYAYGAVSTLSFSDTDFARIFPGRTRAQIGTAYQTSQRSNITMSSARYERALSQGRDPRSDTAMNDATMRYGGELAAAQQRGEPALVDHLASIVRSNRC